MNIGDKISGLFLTIVLLVAVVLGTYEAVVYFYEDASEKSFQAIGVVLSCFMSSVYLVKYGLMHARDIFKILSEKMR